MLHHLGDPDKGRQGGVGILYPDHRENNTHKGGTSGLGMPPGGVRFGTGNVGQYNTNGPSFWVPPGGGHFGN